MISTCDSNEDEKMTDRPSWMDDETTIPPYPLLRCPRCKTIFSDHGIHVCRDLNRGKAIAAHGTEGSGVLR